MKTKLLTMLFFTLCLFLIGAYTQAATVEFKAFRVGTEEVEWSFHSEDPRPLLYLVGVKTGTKRPKNCDDATNLFAVRDILGHEMGRWSGPKETPFHFIFCAFNIRGFLYAQKIISFQ